MRSRKESTFAYIGKIGLAAVLSAFVIVVFFAIIGMTQDVAILKKQATELKTDMQEIMTCIKTNNIEGAVEATDKVEKLSKEMDKTLDSTSWKVASKIPVVGDYINSMFNIMDVLEVTSSEILKPAIDVMSKYPLDSLKAGDGQFNVVVLRAYVELLERLDPAIDQIIASLENINVPDSMGGMVSEYMTKIKSITKSYEEAEEFIPLLKAFIGDGSDKHYLLAAQNSTEIRASGGFPGVIGTITVEDGLLSIGDFKTVYEMLAPYSSAACGITSEEREIFGSWMNNPRDACFSPDFERVAYIWATAYKEEQKRDVNGVVSLTPTIIQELLKYIGEIELSDGTVLDGTNATRVLEHDLYFKYMANTTMGDFFESNDVVDDLFEETAKVTMSRLVEDFSIERIAGYMNIFTSGAKDRTIIMWMKEEAEQELVRKAGASGGLNEDEDKPEVGVYFSMNDPSKMGWYLDMNTIVDTPSLNDDGSLTYDVKVELSNVIDDEERRTGGWYILGNYNGGIRGYLYVISPAGGSISDFGTNKAGGMTFGNFQGHQIAYKYSVPVDPGSDFVVTFKVTTAPGVTTKLGVSSTPTLQNYR